MTVYSFMVLIINQKKGGGEIVQLISFPNQLNKQKCLIS